MLRGGSSLEGCVKEFASPFSMYYLMYVRLRVNDDLFSKYMSLKLAQPLP